MGIPRATMSGSHRSATSCRRSVALNGPAYDTNAAASSTSPTSRPSLAARRRMVSDQRRFSPERPLTRRSARPALRLVRSAFFWGGSGFGFGGVGMATHSSQSASQTPGATKPSSPRPALQPRAYLRYRRVLVLRRLHQPLLQRRHAVLQLLHLGPDARQLLVGGLQLAVGLGQGGALGGDDLGLAGAGVGGLSGFGSGHLADW